MEGETPDPTSGANVAAAADVAGAREILRSCVSSRTRMLDRLLTRIYDDALAPVGLRVNQLTVLSLIASMKGLRAVDAGRLLEMDKSTMSRGLARLRRRGWVTEVRETDPGPKTLALTPEGWTVLRHALPQWRRAGEEAEERLGESGVAAIRGAADAFLRRRAGA